MSSKTTPESGPDPWSDERQKKFRNKSASEYYDPCQEAANRSIKCLHRNGGDRTMCTDYFQAYRDCKKAWQDKVREEKRKSASFW